MLARPSTKYNAEFLAKAVAETPQPVDMDGSPIAVGDLILAPFAKGGSGNAAKLERATVDAVAERPEHQGYGYWTYPIRLVLQGDGRKVWHNYPTNCLKVSR